MTQVAKKINEKLHGALHKEAEIMSGVVQSVDEGNYLMSVMPTLSDVAVDEVMLNAVSANGFGLILIPAVGSNVIIGCVDGPGEYVLLKGSNITKAIILIGNMQFVMDGAKFGLYIGGESLGKIGSDLIDKMLAMTFTNGGGTTSPPNNSTDLSAIKTRLNNFLMS